MIWNDLVNGIALGVLLCIPIVWVATRRTARRVRQLEQRARGAQRLAELGGLTSGLAHEIKNPLSTVGLNLQLMQEDLAELERHVQENAATQERVARMKRRADALARETQRLRVILEDFLRFAGRIKLDLATVPLHQLIDELTDFYTPQAQASGVRLRTQLEAQPDTVVADQAQIKQALLNLLINATQAMSEARQSSNPPKPHGGGEELFIRTQRARALGREELHIHVIDTGPGIPADQLERIFQPYYSTKRHGTGLGLPTSRRIIEEHGGHLTVHSELGRGTDFVIAVPVDGPPRQE
ncbi:MAG: ATP-binding protein [Phycisphaeraceae bacterium]